MAKVSPRSAWAVTTVFLITLLLRPPLAAVGPLLGLIQASLHLNGAQLGLLTSIPVLCFGVGAFAGPRLLKRFGLIASFTGLLILLTVAMLVRPWGDFTLLIAGTVATGLGIAVSNVLFPTLIKVEFPNSVARMTAFYTTGLSAFAAVAAGVAIPLTAALGSWRLTLAVLAVPGVLAVFAWSVTVRLTHPNAASVPPQGEPVNMWRQPLTWALASFFGLQSSNFYVLLNWLPTMLTDGGMTPLSAGSTLAFMSFIGIPVGMLMTANIKRIKNLTFVVWAITVVTALGVGLYALGPSWSILASILAGIGLSSSFPLSLALIGMKGSSQVVTTSMSAISQGVGYLFAALMVFVAGLSHDISHSWLPTISVCIGASVAQAAAGIYATKHPII